MPSVRNTLEFQCTSTISSPYPDIIFVQSCDQVDNAVCKTSFETCFPHGCSEGSIGLVNGHLLPSSSAHGQCWQICIYILLSALIVHSRGHFFKNISYHKTVALKDQLARSTASQLLSTGAVLADAICANTSPALPYLPANTISHQLTLHNTLEARCLWRRREQK